jgi:hypothetical protein
MFNVMAHHPHLRAHAQGLAALGRNGDSTLVHMNPREVMGLQRLAMAHGGSLTINPHTGLPEAFSLGKVLKAFVPMLAGMALAPFTGGLSAYAGWEAAAQAGVGMAAGALTNKLSGEANTLGSLLGAGVGGLSGGSLATSLMSSATPVAGQIGSTAGQAVEGAIPTATPISELAAPTSFNVATAGTGAAERAAIPSITQSTLSPTIVNNAAAAATRSSLPTGLSALASGAKNVTNSFDAFSKFAGANKYALSGATTSALAGMSPDTKNLNPLANQPAEYYNTSYHQKWNPETHTFEQGFTPGTWSSKYAGPGFQPQGPAQDPTNAKGPPGSFDNPYTGVGSFSDPYMDTVGMRGGGGIGSLNAFAHGGTTLGGYSDGGRLLKGPGDGMSDSIPARIVGDKPQPAALADGEFVVPADVVSHLGNGSTEAGSRKLYAMMDKVRQARTGRKKQAPQVKTNKFIPV